MMRVMWLVPAPFPEVREYLGLPPGGKGGWLFTLKDVLTRRGDIRIGIIWASTSINSPIELVKEDQYYCCLPVKRLHHYLQYYNHELQAISEFVNKFQPDIIHVHGTEYFNGLIAQYTKVPVVISIQGLISEIIKDYFGVMPINEIIKCPAVARTYLDMKLRSRTEVNIITNSRFFIGRTAWDREHVAKMNNGSMYYYAPELMRKEFWEAEWNVENAVPKRIYCTSSPHPFKGIDNLLVAVRILSRSNTNIHLRVGGISLSTSVGRYLWMLAGEYGIQDRVEFLGYLPAASIVEEMLGSNVFVMPSMIENSSNSICEAQIVGCPVIASEIGGNPSLIENGKTGLLYPKGDSTVLATQLGRILSDKTLASNIGASAREAARERHDESKAVERYKFIYMDVIRANARPNG